MDSTSIIVVLVLLVACSAFFSATETAFTSFNKIRMKNLAAAGNRKAELVLALADQYDQILTTILIGNNIVNIAAASLATVLFTQMLGDKGVSVSTVLMTVVVLIFGEVSPQSLAKESPEAFALRAAGPLKALKTLLTPLNLLFMGWRRLLSRIFHAQQGSGITEDEIITMVDEAQSEGGIDEHEGNLIRSAIEFKDLEVADILTPRVEVVAIDLDMPLDEVGRLFEEHGFSRLPVYEENLDRIIGVVHEKDFYASLHKGKTNLADMMKNVIFISPGLKISRLLKLLQHTQSHIAVVVDEFGGTAGIVTLEDVLEELVGDIWDEHDEVMEQMRPVGENSYLVSGAASVDKVFRHLEMNEECEWATVNGWVLDMMDRIPRVGQGFTYKGLTVTVTQADSRKVLEVRIQKEKTQHLEPPQTLASGRKQARQAERTGQKSPNAAY